MSARRFRFDRDGLSRSEAIARMVIIQQIGDHLAFAFHLNRAALFKLIFIHRGRFLSRFLSAGTGGVIEFAKRAYETYRTIALSAGPGNHNDNNLDGDLVLHH